MGKRANAEASLYSQLSTKHLNNILMVSGDVLNKRKSEQSTYDIHSKQTQVDVDDAEHGKSLNLNYDAEWSPNDAFSAGISSYYYTSWGQKSRNSYEGSTTARFEYAPITFEDVTGSLFFNWNKANHSLHGEISYNKSTSHTGLEVDGTFLQDIRQNSISPNGFVEYSLVNKAQTAGISASFAYAHLRNADIDRPTFASQAHFHACHSSLLGEKQVWRACCNAVRTQLQQFLFLVLMASQAFFTLWRRCHERGT